MRSPQSAAATPPDAPGRWVTVSVWVPEAPQSLSNPSPGDNHQRSVVSNGDIDSGTNQTATKGSSDNTGSILPPRTTENATGYPSPMIAATMPDRPQPLIEPDAMMIGQYPDIAASRIGGGASSDVFAASHRDFGHVALKRLRGSGDISVASRVIKRARREIDIWRSLSHPNILDFNGVYVHNSDLFLVSPRAWNGTISTYTASHPHADKLRLLAEAADGVAYLHGRAICHGDIKADNILISGDVQAYICDFGLSRLESEDTSPPDGEDEDGGSARWTSAEVLLGAPRSIPSDVWSFGMTISEVLAGAVPFHQLSREVEVIKAIVERKERPPPAPPDSVTGQSYASAWEFAADCWNETPNLRPPLHDARGRFARPPRPYFVLEPLNTTAPVKFFADEIRSAQWIGGGGFGDVYVLDKGDFGLMALKRVRESGDESALRNVRRRTKREVQLWKNLRHPNILMLEGTLETNEYLYLVSPFMKNGSLPRYVVNNPHVDRIPLLAEVAAGIAYLHENSIIHGDVKAENVLISDDGRALVHDFSVSREVDECTSAAVQGQGSVRWMSPELIGRGYGKTVHSDVWAFGILIYEVLSGDIPYKDLSPSRVMLEMMRCPMNPPTEPAASPSGTTYAGAWSVATDCWHLEPSRRSSMEEAHGRLVAM